MIRPIDIRLNAAHPELPLAEAATFTGSPSTVLVRGVPPNCGRWAITAVSVAATYPDGSTTTRAAVQSANGVWVATLPATARSGRTANGLRILADGIDENGDAVTGYILGVADFAVASLGVAPAPEPGETSYQMLYFDAVPGTLRKGDVAKVDGVLKLYNGTAWEAFAGDIPSPSTATPAMDSGTGSAGSSAAFARGDHVHPTDTSRVPTSRKVNGIALANDVALTGADIAVSGTDATKIDAALAGKASTADATLTERGFSAWVWEGTPPTYEGKEVVLRLEDYPFALDDIGKCWVAFTVDGEQCSASGDPGTRDDDNTLSTVTIYINDGYHTATRAALPGYQLGSQSDKPLASEAEAEALRTGKMSASATGADILVGGTGGAASSDMATAIDDLFRLKAGLDSPTFTGTPVAPTPQDGENSALIATTAFVQGAVPYKLVTKTIDNGAVSLDDHASNAVTVSATLSPNTLTINFPTAPSGKLRDFAMRLNIAAGVTAPEIAWPQGVTLENNDGEVPEIADGGTGGSSTILYFSETENNGTTAKFLVKSETLAAITQA